MSLAITLREGRAERSFTGLCLALVTLLLLSFAAALPAGAVSSLDEDADTELIITKLEQPDQFGLPATGMPLGDDIIGDLAAVPGVTFEATLVPGIDVATNDGQREAARMTVTEALRLTEDVEAADRGVTDTNGVVRLGGPNGKLGVGLYLVEEVGAPAGVVPAAPFIVSLPLTDPDARDGWIYTVHVYPKNPRVGVSIEVGDAESVKLGDTVTWTSRSDIPLNDEIDGYIVQNLIAPELELDESKIVISLDADGSVPLTAEDYILRIITVDGRVTIEVEFTESGREKLRAAKVDDPAAEVVIRYETAVQAEGIHVNEVRLYPDVQSYEDGDRYVDAENVTKWGPISVIVHEHGNKDNPIEDARFKLYLTQEDARQGTNPIIIDGVDEWTTGEQGRLIINGLRFSDFVNGLDRHESDPLHRYYWAVPTYLPDGWTWMDDQPLFGRVNDHLSYQTLVFEVVQPETPVTPPETPVTPPAEPDPTDPKPVEPKPDLPLTGARIAGLSILGAVLLAAGGFALYARRSRSA